MSSEVKRYDPINNDGTCGMCVEDADYGAYVEYADYAALEAECERLRQFEIAYNDWQAKTDWVQESAKPHELGRHRADVLRARIEALAAELAAIKGQEAADCKVVPVESLRRWVTGLQLGIISQRSVVEELRAILEAKDE